MADAREVFKQASPLATVWKTLYLIWAVPVLHSEHHSVGPVVEPFDSQFSVAQHNSKYFDIPNFLASHFAQEALESKGSTIQDSKISSHSQVHLKYATCRSHIIDIIALIPRGLVIMFMCSFCLVHLCHSPSILYKLGRRNTSHFGGVLLPRSDIHILQPEPFHLKKGKQTHQYK